MSETMMKKFRNLYKGETMWIIGKGPSLQYLTKEDIGSGPIIAINESIIKIEELDLPNPVFSMQKDGGNRKRHRRQRSLVPDCDYTPNCGDRCGGMVRPKKGATLLVHRHESLYCFPDYSPRYVFDWKELGLPKNRFSQILAIKIGLLMGCTNFRFVSFDVHINGSIETYIPDRGITGSVTGYRGHVWKIKPYLTELNSQDHHYKWIIPKT
ncbi:hypothetical protein KA005_24965 [bacterium]|nr:hypothetical protein [bacterium]